MRRSSCTLAVVRLRGGHRLRRFEPRSAPVRSLDECSASDQGPIELATSSPAKDSSTHAPLHAKWNAYLLGPRARRGRAPGRRRAPIPKRAARWSPFRWLSGRAPAKGARRARVKMPQAARCYRVVTGDARYASTSSRFSIQLACQLTRARRHAYTDGAGRPAPRSLHRVGRELVKGWIHVHEQ